MSNKRVDFTINIGGNAYRGVADLTDKVEGLNASASKTSTLFSRLSSVAFGLNNIFYAVGSVVRSVAGTMGSLEQASNAQQEATAKLTQVMRNMMGAADADTKSILDLASAQQALGVIGDEVQLAGAQELSTYLTKTSTLKRLLPVLNDMVAQQYGFNATQEQSVNIATMLGKVMDGQVGALSRYGYKFDEVQEKILKNGTEAERAATLYEVVESAVGGVNAALAATPEGKMQQLRNDFSDIQEEIGKAYVDLRSRLVPSLSVAVNRVKSLVENFNRIGGFSVVIDKIRTALNNAATAIKDVLPIVAGVTAAVGILTLAIKWQDIVLSLLIVKEGIHTAAMGAAAAATALWTKVQTALNVVLTANPIGLIIAAAAALIGVIVYLVSHIKGWGTAWKGVVGFCSNSWKAFTSEVSYLWEKVSNGVMNGMDKIRMAWYRFRETLGLGDSDANKEALAKLSGDVKKRQEQMAKASNAAGKYARAAADSWKSIDLKWEKTDFAKVKKNISQKLGITDRSTTTSTNVTNDSSLNETLNTSSETINSGGKNVKNYNITINGGLIGSVDNHFASTDEDPASASGFIDRLRDTLLMVVNDVNYAG